MSTIINKLEKAQLRPVPVFDSGDRVRVHFQVIEGARRRTQVFEGVVIKRQGSGARETFTVRKQSFGVGVERTFPVHSTKIEKIEVAARGEVRRAKLYYLRDRVGKSARVRERAWTPQSELNKIVEVDTGAADEDNESETPTAAADANSDAVVEAEAVEAAETDEASEAVERQKVTEDTTAPESTETDTDAAVKADEASGTSETVGSGEAVESSESAEADATDAMSDSSEKSDATGPSGPDEVATAVPHASSPNQVDETADISPGAEAIDDPKPEDSAS